LAWYTCQVVTIGMVYILGEDTWHCIQVRWRHMAWYTCQVMTLGMVYILGDDTWHGTHVRW